jgi:excinuclease ABC subunit C|tara:strand:- start:408 stop:2210 length:1803 start_codon:yes stop_codon:yes gene_type:complete
MEHFQFDKTSYNHVPKDPGVYKFFNTTGTLLYVGKAKVLKNRVASYFTNKTLLNRKTQRLVSQIDTIEVTIVNSEYDALLLENNLIKENQPKFNILLKDDKTFPFLVVTNERFPKIYATRKVNPDKGTHFGPYTSVRAMHKALDLISKLYHVRSCNLNLSEKNIIKQKFNVCLEYHIGNCLGPCENLQSETDYMNDIDQAKLILKGIISPIKTLLKEDMNRSSSLLKFELAAEYKAKLQLLETFQSKSLIVNPSITDIDIVTILTGEDISYVNFMKVEMGTIRASETVLIKSRLKETTDEILAYAVPVLRQKFNSHSPTIISNLSFKLPNIMVIIPQIGDKKKLLDLSMKNSFMFKQNHLRIKTKQQDDSERTLRQLQQDLRLKSIPRVIECFDNSNIQGTHPTASMVYFKNGKPLKQQYRHYNIKTVIGPDDFSSMTEIIHRRYKRLLTEDKALPDLIVVDGGKGQLSAACISLKNLNLYGKIPIIGIAKRLEEIYFPEDSIPIYLSKKSSALKLLQFIRDEAHRFAITHHRNIRSNDSITSILDDIPGIGPKNKTVLLTQFKTLSQIRNTSIQVLTDVIGKKLALNVHNYLNKKKGTN